MLYLDNINIYIKQDFAEILQYNSDAAIPKELKLFSIYPKKQESETWFSSMASKPIDIRWTRTGSQPYWKIMYSIVLQIISHKYKDKNL